VHTDHLGSGRKLTDANGNVVYRGEFDPHGQVMLEWSDPSGATNKNSKKFTGYERDSATNLDYAQAQMYHHNRARFMQPDQLGLRGANPRKPQTLNRYAYAGNDPVNFVDPSGLDEIPWMNCNNCSVTIIGNNNSGSVNTVPGIIGGDVNIGILLDGGEDGGVGGGPDPDDPIYRMVELLNKALDEALDFLARSTEQSRNCYNALRGPVPDGVYFLLKKMRENGRIVLGTVPDNPDGSIVWAETKEQGISAQTTIDWQVFTTPMNIRTKMAGVDVIVTLSTYKAVLLVIFHELSHATGRYTDDPDLAGLYQEYKSNSDITDLVYKECLGSNPR
jgi:RHS repeat-associated protein